jgi:hypothetical protein
MIDKGTFGDINQFPILGYLNDKFESLNKTERSIFTRNMQQINKLYVNLNQLYNNSLVESWFIKNTALLHKQQMIKKINETKLPTRFKSNMCNYLNAKLKKFTQHKVY